MSRDDEIRRQLGMGMPTPGRNIAQEQFSITTVSHVEPEKPKLKFQIYLGVWMVDDGTGWRAATVAEVEEHMGGAACWPFDTGGGALD